MRSLSAGSEIYKKVVVWLGCQLVAMTSIKPETNIGIIQITVGRLDEKLAGSRYCSQCGSSRDNQIPILDATAKI